MKKTLYFVLSVTLLLGGLMAYFFWVVLPIPELILSANNTPQQNAILVDEWLTKMQQDNKFNGAVLWIHQNKVMLNKGYGYTDASGTSRLTNTSAMRLGSISKQFTAAGILVLTTQQKLALNDEVTTYIPSFPYPGVTIRHLLNQVSGVPDAYMELAEAKEDEIKLLTNTQAVDLVCVAKLPANFAPNEAFEYSNTNYILLARIIEIVSGKSFEEFMQIAVFDPLKMRNSHVWNLLSTRSFPNKASTFSNHNGDRTPLEPTFLDGVAGDGAVFCSTSDFVIWNQFWNGNSLVADSLLQQAFTPPILNDGTLSDYGFGWVITERGMWHNGAWLGARTMFARNVSKGNCFVLLDNSDNPRVREILEYTKPLVNGLTK